MEYLIENANLTGLTRFLNKNFHKKSGEEFNRRDVVGYIERGFLPSYIGGNKIVRADIPNCSTRLYSIVK